MWCIGILKLVSSVQLSVVVNVKLYVYGNYGTCFGYMLQWVSKVTSKHIAFVSNLTRRLETINRRMALALRNIR